MKRKCFVIMPFSTTDARHDEEYWNIFFGIIKKIMEDKDYTCIRSEVGPYEMLDAIIENFENSDIVIAVLTDFNSNVWYELGIRHTLKTGTIMLLQEGQKIPFDVSHFGIVFYKDSIGLEQRLKDSIGKYLDKIDDSICDSPVISTLNSKVYNTVEKKLEEMQQLIWRLVDEVPRENSFVEKGREKRNRILWVDDYPKNNELIINLFQSKNIEFDIALTTEQGLELYKSRLYDLVITDMGRGDEQDAGLVLLRSLRLLRCQIPIIVYSSYKAIKRYGDEALRSGAFKVIHGTGDIISTISDILELQ